ncbi:LysR family transcriptional regulator [Agromyces mariniharenae]|uniref:LysR family transcriptional regulator n=1 Tax=Agromyces mariniharenae TaxID=2604423 RepID=UPI003083536A
MSGTSSLSRLDLNLLVSLDALLTERSVTRAADRLHLSQPALSASLARLRAHFNDPILARTGNTYELTPLASRLAEHTAAALDAAQRVFASKAEWDPSRSTREFAIHGSDYAVATVGRRIAALAAERAPGVRFRFMMHDPQIVDEALDRLRSADALLMPHGFLTDLPFTDLWTDTWVVVAAEENEAVIDGVTLEHAGRLPWVFTSRSRSAFTSATRQVQQFGIEPRVEAVVESFLALPLFIAGTDRLGLLQSGLAEYARNVAASAYSNRRSTRRRSTTRCGGIRCTVGIPSTSGCERSRSRRRAGSSPRRSEALDDSTTLATDGPWPRPAWHTGGSRFRWRTAVADLNVLAQRHLDAALADEHGRSAELILRDGPMRQTIIALRDGVELAEHNSPAAASLQVLVGSVRVTGQDVTDIRDGRIEVLTHHRHAVLALEDAVFLLTTVTSVEGSVGGPERAR